MNAQATIAKGDVAKIVVINDTNDNQFNGQYLLLESTNAGVPTSFNDNGFGTPAPVSNPVFEKEITAIHDVSVSISLQETIADDLGNVYNKMS